jgi:hypothetical protein
MSSSLAAAPSPPEGLNVEFFAPASVSAPMKSRI